MGKVTVVGSINTDMVFTSHVRPSAGETVLGDSFSVIPGGKGANQAVASSKLGALVSMIGCVGDDGNGEFSIKNLQSMKVITEGIEKVSDATTGVAGIIVAENDNSIIVVSGANHKLTMETIDKFKSVIISSDIVLLQLEIPIDVVEYTLKLCKANNVRTILNPAPAVALSRDMVENADFITPNQHELKIIFGRDSSEDEDTIIRKYPNKLIVTMGSRGVKYFDGNEIKSVPAFKVNVVDTTGAGDTFNGALAAAIVSGQELEGAIRFANKAAAIATTKLGAQSGMPGIEEMQKML